MIRLLAASFLTFAMAPTSFAAAQWEVFKIRLRLTAGNSYYDYRLATPQNISPFQIFYIPTEECRGFTVRVSVWYPNGSAWDPAVYNNSVFTTPDRDVYAVKLEFQTPNAGQTCDISLVTLRDPSQPEPEPEPQPEPQPEPEPEPQPEPEQPEPDLPGQWMDAGILNFPGGDHQQGNLQLNAPYYARDIAFNVPEECKDVRIEEAGILRQGMFTKANPVPNQPGLFRLNEISSFRQARVIISGPEGQNCQIGIRVFDHT